MKVNDSSDQEFYSLQFILDQSAAKVAALDYITSNLNGHAIKIKQREFCQNLARLDGLA